MGWGRVKDSINEAESRTLIMGRVKDSNYGAELRTLLMG